jgi:hypothetical protein
LGAHADVRGAVGAYLFWEERCTADWHTGRTYRHAQVQKRLGKETIMQRPYVPTALLTLVLSLRLGSLALASRDNPESVLPRVVATVLVLDPRGLATIQTVDGARYEVLTGTGWRVGDTVTCEHIARTHVKWETLNCRKS